MTPNSLPDRLEKWLARQEPSAAVWLLRRLHPVRVVYSAIAGILLSLSLWLFPKYVALIYMRYYGFYDSDFIESSFTNSLIFFEYYLVPLAVALFFFLPIFFFTPNIWKKDKFFASSVGLMGAVASAIFIYAFVSYPTFQSPIICGFISSAIGLVFVFFSRRSALLASSLLVVSIVIAMAFFAESTASSYKHVLARAGLGGFHANIELASKLNSDRVNFPQKDTLYNGGQSLTAYVALIGRDNIYIAQEFPDKNLATYYHQRAILPRNNLLLIAPTTFKQR